jgi:hypothetical protein
MAQVTSGPAREKIDLAEMTKLQRSVIIDNRRKRPLYFDGRFLAAADLTREQSYFLTRQADLGRAGGFGVVRGLMVTPGDAAGSLHIEAGHGVTPSGSTVLLPDSLQVSLSDIPTSQRLDASFGLLELPRAPAASRSGLFLVALRPRDRRLPHLHDREPHRGGWGDHRSHRHHPDPLSRRRGRAE